MKQFIYKIIIVIIAIVLVYELTIAKQIKLLSSQTEIFLSKEGRKEGVQKLRDEMKKAIEKDRYLSKEDAQLINKFLKKIATELKESAN